MQRRHDIDALRVIAFAFLILYHVAMAYVWDWNWHVKSSYQTEALQLPMLFINRWRMGLLFLISGIAIGLFGPEDRPGRFAWSRTGRVLVPLLFGMVAIVPVQAYCQGVSNGLVEPGFGQFLLRYFSFQTWPKNAFDGWEHGFTWNHLWYLAYLWVYTLLLMALLPLGRTALLRRLGAWFAGLRGLRLVLLPAVLFSLYLIVLGARFEATNDLVHDWFQHAQFFTLFLVGYLMARNQGMWEEVTRLRLPLLIAAIAIFAAYRLYIGQLTDSSPEWQVNIARVLRGSYMWTSLLWVLGYGHAWLNRPFRWLPYATEAIFPCYVLHQSLIVVLVFWLAPKHLGPVLEPVLVLGGTVVGCLALHEFVIRRVGFLRPLFGLKRKAAAAEPKPVPVAAMRMADDTA